MAGGLKGSRRTRLDAAVECFRRAGREVELFPTDGPNMAGGLGQAAIAHGFDLLLAAGGDGTINEVLNGIVGSKIAFGALPAGTANVLACEVGLPGRPDLAAQHLLDAEPVRIGVGSLVHSGQSPRYFLLMAGVGLDARIVHELDLDLKRKLGKLAYFHGGFKQFGRPTPRFRVAVNGAEYTAGFALFARVRNYGGDFEIARNIRLTDKDFEIVIAEHSKWHDYVRFFAAVATNRLESMKGVRVLRGTQAELSPVSEEAVHVQGDGESIGSLPASITFVPDAISLLLPQAYLNKR